MLNELRLHLSRSYSHVVSRFPSATSALALENTMSAPQTSAKRAPRVLITNDDGPPDLGHSPFVYPFAEELARSGWEVKVVVPSSQRSWVSKSYLIAQETTGTYYYPKGPDGTEGEKADLPRPLKDGEHVEWILLNGTPGELLPVLPSSSPRADSGVTSYLLQHRPAFAVPSWLIRHGHRWTQLWSQHFNGLCSVIVSRLQHAALEFRLNSPLRRGTIGAAMSAAISGVPSIALSWGLMTHYKPPGKDIVDAAARVSCDVVKRLWELGFGEGENKCDVYSVNVPVSNVATSHCAPSSADLCECYSSCPRFSNPRQRSNGQRWLPPPIIASSNPSRKLPYLTVMKVDLRQSHKTRTRPRRSRRARRIASKCTRSISADRSNLYSHLRLERSLTRRRVHWCVLSSPGQSDPCFAEQLTDDPLRFRRRRAPTLTLYW